MHHILTTVVLIALGEVQHFLTKVKKKVVRFLATTCSLNYFSTTYLTHLLPPRSVVRFFCLSCTRQVHSIRKSRTTNSTLACSPFVEFFTHASSVNSLPRECEILSFCKICCTEFATQLYISKGGVSRHANELLRHDVMSTTL